MGQTTDENYVNSQLTDKNQSARELSSISNDSNDMSQRAHSILSWYLQGQLADVVKAAIWWSTYGVIAEALSGYAIAVGLTRLVFNFALVIFSPVASALVEKISIWKLLLTTAGGRLAVWCFIIPILWIIANFLDQIYIFDIGFLILMFLDGAQVSFSNVVDIDCGGLDTLAQQYGLAVGNLTRDRFDRIHQLVFDSSFLLLTPPCTLLIWLVALWFRVSCQLLPLNSVLGHFTLKETQGYTALMGDNKSVLPLCGHKDVGILLYGIAFLFGSLTLFSMWKYNQFKKYAVERDFSPSNGPILISSEPSDEVRQRPRTRNLFLQDQTRTSCFTAIYQSCCDFGEGLQVVFKEKPIKWRLVFLAFETALEDSVVSVIIPQIAIQFVNIVPKIDGFYLSNGFYKDSTEISVPGGWTLVNLVAVLCIAIGKFGGLIAATYMNSHWLVPYSLHLNGPYLTLFKYMFISGASLILLPLSFAMLTYPRDFTLFFQLIFSVRVSAIIVIALSLAGIASAFFLFFLFSAIPKMGFATLLHSFILQKDVDAKVFGCIGTCVTMTDAIVILIINTIFAFFRSNQFLMALWIAAILYAIHGACELYIAPKLILSSEADTLNNTEDFPSMPTFINNPTYASQDFASSDGNRIFKPHEALEALNS